MFRCILAVTATLATAGSAFPQTGHVAFRQGPEPKFAGTYYVAENQFVPATPGEEGLTSTTLVYNHTAAPSGFFVDAILQPGPLIDEGILPDASLVAGGQDTYRITRIIIGYGTDTPDVSMGGDGADITVTLYDRYLACDDEFGTLGSGPPVASLNLTSLPGSVSGRVETFIVALDLTGAPEICLRSSDGIDPLGLGYSYTFNNGTVAGPLIAGDPDNCPPGDGTFYQNPSVGCDGTGIGTGLGAQDLFWCSGCAFCAFFGGYPANPFGGLFLALDAELNAFCCPGPENYCVGGTNQDGEEASISVTGSTSVSDNSFGLEVNGVSSESRFGLFVFGANQAQIPFQQGFLCIELDNTFARLNPILTYSNVDQVTRAIDFDSAPSDVIDGGETWNFQFWYRDFGETNLSDAVSVCFTP